MLYLMDFEGVGVLLEITKETDFCLLVKKRVVLRNDVRSDVSRENIYFNLSYRLLHAYFERKKSLYLVQFRSSKVS